MAFVMATKNILLAIADNQTVADINEALGNEWLTTPVASEADVLALLEAGSFDALVADFNLGDSDASELLNQALEKCPDMTRFLLAYEADLALVAAKVSGSTEILPKPIESATLKSRIETAFSDPSTNDVGLATGFDTASSIPAVYDEVIKALNSPEVTSQQVGDIIATDDALIQEILLLTRSAYLGLPSKILEPVDATKSPESARRRWR
jgi:CheY-like chemotaxis protein